MNDIRTDVPAAFEYAPEWLASGHAFMLDPRLDLYIGKQHPAHPASAFGVFMDSAPDRWGRVLMERREAINARREDRSPMPPNRQDIVPAPSWAPWTTAPSLHSVTHQGTINRERVVDFLHAVITRDAPECPTLIVLDSARIHRHLDDGILDRWRVSQRTILVCLPPYSPKLNSIKILWRKFKDHWRRFVTWRRQVLRPRTQRLAWQLNPPIKQALRYARCGLQRANGMRD